MGELPTACPRCLARPLLLRGLAANLDRSVDRRRGDRAVDLLALDDQRLAGAVSPSASAAAAAIEYVHSGGAHRELEAQLRASDCWAVCAHDPLWPAGLERLGEAAPRALLCRGAPERLAALKATPLVTVVGARRSTPYGREVARELSRLLSASGVVVVSGMALGIDAVAHEGALECGTTVAILGSGPDRPYPRSRARLYREIVERGLVISELPPVAPTFRWTFPARNRLMAALGGLTVVVEAAERSGSLITAEMAGELGRTVGAVPGPVTSWRSSGANALLADGAHVIRDARDALECLLGPGAAPPERRGPPIAERGRQVLAAVEEGSATPDAVAAACSLEAGEAAVALSMLELDGYVESDAGGRYRRTSVSLGGSAP